MTRYLRAAMVAVAVGFVFTVVSAAGATGPAGRLGGDLPAFYGAGAIAAAGDWSQLYSEDRQIEAQAELFTADGAYLAFAYPPVVAQAYEPLAALPYPLAYLLHTLAMAALLVGGLCLLRPVVPIVGRHFEPVVIASLLFFPMLRAVTGGQNAALTAFLIAAAWRAWHDDRDLIAGLALAALLFKPQYAIPLLVLALLSRRWRTAISFGLGAGAIWLHGTAVLGWGWLGPWWEQASTFGERDAEANAANAVSWIGILGSAGYALAGLTAVGLALIWVRPGRWSLTQRMAVTMPAVILISPHAMFYDVGLLVLAGVALVTMEEARPGGGRPWLVGWLWLAGFCQLLAGPLGRSPLILLVISTLAVAVSHLHPRTAQPFSSALVSHIHTNTDEKRGASGGGAKGAVSRRR